MAPVPIPRCSDAHEVMIRDSVLKALPKAVIPLWYRERIEYTVSQIVNKWRWGIYTTCQNHFSTDIWLSDIPGSHGQWRNMVKVLAGDVEIALNANVPPGRPPYTVTIITSKGNRPTWAAGVPVL